MDDDFFRRLLPTSHDTELSFVDDYDDQLDTFPPGMNYSPGRDPFSAAPEFYSPVLPPPVFAPSSAPAAAPKNPSPRPKTHTPRSEREPQPEQRPERERTEGRDRRRPKPAAARPVLVWETPDFSSPSASDTTAAAPPPDRGILTGVGRARHRTRTHHKPAEPAAPPAPAPTISAASVPPSEARLTFPPYLLAIRRVLDAVFVCTGALFLLLAHATHLTVKVHRRALSGVRRDPIHVGTLIVIALAMPLLFASLPHDVLIVVITTFAILFFLAPQDISSGGGIRTIPRRLLGSIMSRWLQLTFTITPIYLLREPLVSWLGFVVDFNASLRLCTAYMILIFHSGLTFSLPVVVHWLVVSIGSILGGDTPLVLYIVGLTILLAASCDAFARSDAKAPQSRAHPMSGLPRVGSIIAMMNLPPGARGGGARRPRGEGPIGS